jgi:hypothetical protein
MPYQVVVLVKGGDHAPLSFFGGTADFVVARHNVFGEVV